MRRLALALTLALPLAAVPASTQEVPVAGVPFDAGADAAEALTVALEAARIRMSPGENPAWPMRVLAVFGANWCHDSRDLATMLDRPRISRLLDQHYLVVLIDAGMPQSGNGRNLDLAARYGVPDISGTPTVLVLDEQGRLLNTPDNARGWRNASTRSEDEVYRFLRQWAKPQD